MSEFTEKLNSSELVSHAWDEIDRDQASAGLLIDTISNEFKDWQPPKLLLKIPQFMADWFEYQLKNNNDLDKFDGNDVFRIIQDVIKVSNGENTWEDYGITDEIAKFAEDNEELFLNLIVNCSLGYGYTVECEQLYEIRLPLPKGNYASIDSKGYIWGDLIPNKYKLTESEVKNIDERYWPFAVPVEEVEL